MTRARGAPRWLAPALAIAAITGCGALEYDVVLGARDGGPGDTSATEVCPPAEPAIVAGAEHTCALERSGRVLCWGGSGGGQVGAGAMEVVTEPTEVLACAQAIGAGAAHTCAIDRDRVWCWGANDFGQLGDGSRTLRDRPAHVQTLAGASRVTGGAGHTCVIAGGRVFCWGAASLGELGIAECVPPAACEPRDVPTEVPGIDDAVDVVAGISATCALRASGEVSCWGSPRPLATPLPSSVEGISDAVEIALRFRHACARLASGETRCWGMGTAGELGTGVASVATSTPLPSRLGPARGLAAGRASTCTIQDDGTWCVGDDAWGQLGGVSGGGPTLEPVRSPLAPVLLALGNDHACGLDAEGRIACIGSDARGQRGDGP